MERLFQSFSSGRLVHDPQVRRYGPGAGDQQGPRRVDGRSDRGPERVRPRLDILVHRPLEMRCGREADWARYRPSCSGCAVLVLDGQAATRQHLVDIFQAWAVPADTADTPSEAIEKLRAAAESRRRSTCCWWTMRRSARSKSATLSPRSAGRRACRPASISSLPARRTASPKSSASGWASTSASASQFVNRCCWERSMTTSSMLAVWNRSRP